MDTFFQVLEITRDVAIIWLVLLGLITAAVPLFVLLKITQGLRWLLQRLVPTMRTVQAKTNEIAAQIERVLAAIRAPFAWGQRTADRMRTTALNIQGRLHRGGIT